MEKQMRKTIDEKEKEVRRIREEAQTVNHRHESELELCK